MRSIRISQVLRYVIRVDTDLLKTFVAVIETGGFTKASARRHLTQSTVSMQMKRLAEELGQPLFTANGRGRVPTGAAEVLFGYAERILALQEEALAALNGTAREVVRVGATQDFAEARLPGALRAFSASHSEVAVAVRVGQSRELERAVLDGELDLAVVFETGERPRAPFSSERGAWLGSPSFLPPRAGEPWPLALFEAPCVFRDAAMRSLDAAGIPWRVAYSTPSLSGLLAAVRAGLAVTLRLARHSQKGLKPVPAAAGLPAAPRFRLSLVKGDRPSAGARALATVLRAEAKR
ncbi:MAG TPA: LysR substrate-binding domain-containing protein [Polyangiaceae bacterium]|nr:LysR substrate-binding domain-containing protein [Polyangiaceae bacterium]